VGPHTVRLMPASDLSGHDDGPDRLVASLPVSPSNRFAKPSGGVPIARCGWDARPVQTVSGNRLRVPALLQPLDHGFIKADSSAKHRDID